MAEKTLASVPEVVNRTVSRVAASEGFSKPQFYAEAGANAEDGYTSCIFRVTLRDESAQKEDLMMMVKVPDPTSENQAFKLAFVSEVQMYKSILPAYQEIGNMKGSLPWPRCLYASAEGPETSLVFEDLRVKGFVMANRRVAMDAAHCRLALSHLAKFHGAGIALQHLKPDTFKTLAESLKNPYSSPDMQAVGANLSSMWGPVMAALAEKYPQGSAEFSKIVERMQSYGNEATKLPSTKEPGAAIVHGDCQVNNFMFRYDKTSAAVTECTIIDFQMCQAGPTAKDLASLLLPCTEKSMRDKHWKELLRGYHTELQNTLRSAGCKDPDAVYSWTQFMECMRQAAFYGFIVAPVLLNAQFADQQAAEEFREVLHDVGHKEEKSATFNIKFCGEMKRRLIEIVQSLFEWDWL